MSISLFSYDSNPDIDPRMCRQSNARIAELVREGRAFMIDSRRAQLFAPRLDMLDWRQVMNQPALIPGRNSCRKVGRDDRDNIYFKVQGFSYPIPACGARSRPMYVRVINKVPLVGELPRPQELSA